ncbi:MAG: BACON domain-containing protein, partial [Gammaproteobacteria bacterium AqS3]|nr:BACON domain-containing protein [Gammaproteobacteria bacterium AqS3]
MSASPAEIFCSRQRLLLLVGTLLMGLAFSVPAHGQDTSPALVLSETSKTINEGSYPGEIEFFDLKVRLATRPTADVEVSFASNNADVTVDTNRSMNGIQSTPLTFTPSNWQTDQVVLVIAAHDTDYDNDSAVISLAAAGGDYSSVTGRVTVKVLDGSILIVDTGSTDGALHITEGASTSFTVKLARQPSENVIVVLQKDWWQGALQDIHFDTDVRTPGIQDALTFTPSNWNSLQRVAVDTTVNADDYNEQGRLGIKLLGGAGKSILVHWHDVYDPNSSPHIWPLTHSILWKGFLKVNEGGNRAMKVDVSRPGVFTMVSDNPDVTPSPSKLIITGKKNISATKPAEPTVTVSAANDDDALDEWANISFIAANGIIVGSAQILVIDDDTGEVGLTLSKTYLELYNTSPPKTFSVRLDTQPSEDVKISIASGESAMTITPDSLTFTAKNWKRRRNVTVGLLPKTDATRQTSKLLLTASGGEYEGQSAEVILSISRGNYWIQLYNFQAVNEGGNGDFSLELLYPPITDLAESTVNLSVQDNPDVTISPTSLTFTSDNFAKAQTVTVSAAEDSDTLDEYVTIFASLSEGERSYRESTRITIPIIDNDRRELDITPTELSLTEGGSDTFTVQLTNRPSGNVTVTLQQPGNTDVTVDKTSLSFTADNWSAAQTVTVSAAEDTDGLGESASVELSASGADYEGVSGRVTVRVTDNDTAGETPGIIVAPAILDVDENSSDTFTVLLDAQPSEAVTISIPQPSDTDVTVDKTSLTFTTANWNQTQTVTVSAAEDDDAANETVSIALTASGGNYAGLKGNVAVTVADNDRSLELSPYSVTVAEGDSETFTVKLAGQPSGQVTVNLIQSGTTNSDVTVDKTSLTFTTDSWNKTQTVTVNASEDADETDDTATISLTASGGDYAGVTASMPVTVNDNEVRLEISKTSLIVTEDSSDTFTIKLTGQPPADVTVTLVRSGDEDVKIGASPAALGSQTTLTFSTDNWSAAQTVTVNAGPDDDSADDKATIDLTATGAGIAPASVKVTVTDDDDGDVGLSLSGTSLRVNEGGTLDIGFYLDARPGNDRILTLTRSGNNSSAVTLNPTTLTFTRDNWDIVQTLTVTAVEDDNDEDETVTISLSGARIANSPFQTQVFVNDNDSGNTIILNKTWLGLDEGATNAEDSQTSGTFRVRLSSPPSADRTVNMSSTNSNVTVAPASLTFTPSNWKAPQTVRVGASSDDAKQNYDADINLTGAGLTGRSLRVSVQDPQYIGATLSPTALSINEGDSDSFTIRVNSKPHANRTVRLTVSDGKDDRITRDKKVLTFTPLNWSTPQKVTVNASEDENARDGASMIHPQFRVVNDDGAYGWVDADSPPLTVSVIDDDIASRIRPRELTVIEGTSGSFEVRLKEAPSSAVTVDISLPSGSDVTVDKTSLTFGTDNWGAFQTVTVNAGRDDDSDDDTVQITVNGDDVGIGSVDVTVREIIKVHRDENILIIGEGESDTFSYVLKSRPSSDRTITMRTTDADVTLSTAGGASSQTLTLTFTPDNWSDEQSVTVSVAEDDADVSDSDEYIDFTLDAGLVHEDRVDERLQVGLLDDDIGITLSTTSLTLAEGGSGTFTVEPSSEIQRLRKITLESDNDDVTISPSSLTFYNTTEAQTVTVTATEDADGADDTATISLTGNPLKAASLTVTVTDDDVGLQVSTTSLTIAEGGNGSFTVRLDAQPPGNVTVTLTQPTNTDVTVDTDTGEPDNQTELEFTTDNWDDEQTVMVNAAADDDTINDSAEINIQAGDGDYADSKKTVTVSVTEKSLIIVAPDPFEVREGGENTFTLRLSAQPTGDVTITYTVPAIANQVVGTASFLAKDWHLTRTQTVEMNQDDNADDETVELLLTASGGGYDGVTGRLTVKSLDDDVGLEVSATSLNIVEGGSGTFTVRLDAQPPGNVTVTLTQPENTDVTIADTDPGTAGIQTTLTFTTDNWSTARTVTVNAAEDADAITDTADIKIKAGDGDYSGERKTVTVSVTENQTAGLTITAASPFEISEGGVGTFTVKLNSRPSEDVTVTLTLPVDSDVTLGADVDTARKQTTLEFTTSNWSTAQTVTARAAGDDDSTDDSATISLTASGGDYEGKTDSVTVTVKDDDVGLDVSTTSLTVAEGGSGIFTVRLDAKPQGSVTVTLTQPTNPDVTVDTDTGEPGNQTALIFTASRWNIARTVTVYAAADEDAIVDTATVAIQAGDGDYSGERKTVTVDVTETDTAALTVTADDPFEVDEGGHKTFTVQLASEPSGEVTVTLSQQGVANADISFDTDAGEDGNQDKLTFTTANWDEDQTVTVRAAEDPDAIADSVVLRLSAEDGDYDGVGATLSVSVRESDTAALSITADEKPLEVDEGGEETFNVALATKPSANVTVTLAQPDNTDVTINKTSLTFTTANWNTAQTVTVSAAGDDDATDDTATISLDASGSGYGSVTGALQVKVKDDDAAELVLSWQGKSKTVPEDDTVSVLKVRLKTRPSAEVTVDVELKDSPPRIFISTGARLTFSASDSSAQAWNSD